MSEMPGTFVAKVSSGDSRTDARESFSFIHGRWLVHNRRLKDALSKPEEWVEFDASLVCVPVLNGLGNVDEMRCGDGRLIGSALRTYDIASGSWSDYWIAAHDGVLTEPLRGVFDNGIGEFQGTDICRGKRVLVRYVWTDLASRPRWEQAYSADEGKTWQINWIMTYERLPEPGLLPWPTDWTLPARNLHAVRSRSDGVTVAAQHPSADENFSFLYGRWRVHNRKLVEPLSGRDAWREFEASSSSVPLLNGMANLDEMREADGTLMGIALRTFDLRRRTWSIYWVAGRDGLLQPPVQGRFDGNVGTFTGPDSYNGRSILVRYTWHRDSRDRLRWEQAFARDNGRAWETNWFMRFERADDQAVLPWDFA